MRKILFLSYYWPPSGGPGVQRALKFNKYFAKFDVDSTVITVDERKASYPLMDLSLSEEISSNQKVIKTNSFEALSIYKWFSKKKQIPYSGFVNVDKTTLFQKISRFIRGNLFIPDARVGWVKYAYKAAYDQIKKGDVNVIVTTSPPHSTQVVGLELKAKTNLPWIADLRDPWTDIFFYKDFYHLPFAKRIDANYERRVLEESDQVVVTSQATKELYLTKSDKIYPDKIHVIPNGYDETDFKKEASFDKKSFVITYSGTIADQYDVDVFLEELKRLKEKHSAIPVKIRFVGKVSEGIQAKLAKNELKEHCEFVGYVSHEESISYLLESSVLLIVIPKIKNNEGIVPGKIFEYLAARKPILCLGPENCNVGEFISECDAGATYDYSNKNVGEFIEAKMLQWQNDPNLNLAKDTYKKYSRKELTKQFSEIIKNL